MKKNKILIIFLNLIILTLGGYIIYDKYISKKVEVNKEIKYDYNYLNDILKNYTNGFDQYFLVDIDDDSYSDLLIKNYVENIDSYNLIIYKGTKKGYYYKGISSLGKDSNNIISKKENTNYLVIQYAHSGFEQIRNIYIDQNTYKEKIILSHNTNNEYQKFNNIISFKNIKKIKE